MPHHLFSAGRFQDLFAVASNEDFLAAQASASPADPELPLRCIRDALRAAIEMDEAVKMAEFVLSHCNHLRSTTVESPLEALRAGRTERAWGLVEANPIAARTRWYRLLW